MSFLRQSWSPAQVELRGHKAAWNFQFLHHPSECLLRDALFNENLTWREKFIWFSLSCDLSTCCKLFVAAPILETHGKKWIIFKWPSDENFMEAPRNDWMNFVFNCSRLAKPVVITTELIILLRIFSLSLFLLWCLRGAAYQSAAEDANHLFESLNLCVIFEICDTSKYLVHISWFLVMTEYLVRHQQCSLTPDKVLLYHMLKCACSAAHICFYIRLSALRCNNCVCQPSFPPSSFTLNFDHRFFTLAKFLPGKSHSRPAGGDRALCCHPCRRRDGSEEEVSQLVTTDGGDTEGNTFDSNLISGTFCHHFSLHRSVKQFLHVVFLWQ